jgi:hypothetical protein
MEITVEKSRPTMWNAFVINKKVPKINNHPMGEKWPNLVTLIHADPGSMS